MRIAIPHKIIDGVEYKKCSKCNTYKVLGDFHKDRKMKNDGLFSVCKKCRHIHYTVIAEERYSKYVREMFGITGNI